MKSKRKSIRINKVYTRSGDSGKTSLADGEIRFKDDDRIESYGAIDELNAHLGCCNELLEANKNKQFLSVQDKIIDIQNELFNIGAYLASGKNKNEKNFSDSYLDKVKKMEIEIDTINESLTGLESFVLPGGSIINAHFHIARTICRRAERRVIKLSKIETVNAHIIIYLNRLSDLLFVWSRWISKLLGHQENLWKIN